MDKILILLAVALGVALVFFFMMNPTKDGNAYNPKMSEVTISIGPVPIVQVKASEKFTVDFKDEAMAPRLEKLYKEGKLLIFQGQAVVGTILALEKGYSNAEEKAREELSRFISTVVKVATGRILDCSSNAKVCSSVYTSASMAISETLQFGAKVILKYRDFEFGVGWRCGVALFYDPSLAVDAIRTNAKLREILKTRGIDPEEFAKQIDEAIRETKR